jgi:hypothetical protein
MTLLRRAVLCESTACIKVILDAFLRLLTDDNQTRKSIFSPYQGESVPDYRKCAPHIADLISVEDICMVASKAPDLFVEFIEGLQIVRNYAFTLSSRKMDFDTGDKYCGTVDRVERGMWGERGLITELEAVKSHRSSMLQPFIIPLKRIAGYKSPFLKAVVHAVNRLGKYEVFNNEVVQSVVLYKWNTYIKTMFMKDFFLLVALAVLFFANAVTFEGSLESTSLSIRRRGQALLLSATVLSCYFVFREARLLIKSRSYPRKMTTMHLVASSLAMITLALQCRIAFGMKASSRLNNTASLLSAITLPPLGIEVQ